MTRKFMTTIKISKEIHKNMLHNVISNSFGMRGKSKWIIEAFDEFLQLDNFPEYVDIASEMTDLSEIISMRLPEDLLKKLDQAVMEVRKKYPLMEGVRSNIMRASIIQKLIRR